MDAGPEAYLPLASFALAAGALAVRLIWRGGRARETLIAACLIFILLASGLHWRRTMEIRQHTRKVAEEIVKVIGNEKKTYEDILYGLRQPDSQVTMRALDLLIAQERVGSEPKTLIDKADNDFHIRLYFVRTPAGVLATP